MMSGTVRIRKVVLAIHVALPVLWRIFLDMTAASKATRLAWITRFFPWDDQRSGRRKRSPDLTKCWTPRRSTESLLSLICRRRSLRSCIHVWLKLSLFLSLSLYVFELWLSFVCCFAFCIVYFINFYLYLPGFWSYPMVYLLIFVLFLELSVGQCWCWCLLFCLLLSLLFKFLLIFALFLELVLVLVRYN